MYIKTLYLGECVTSCHLASADGKRFVLVDPADNADKILKVLHERGGVLCAVLLTHGHFDHIYALPGILEAFPDISVYVHEYDAVMLRDMSLNLSGPLFGVPFTFNGSVKTVCDKDIIDVAGIECHVIHTPGHTPGSVCYYAKSDNVLFSGDTLFASTVGRTDFPGGDMTLLMRSLQALKALPDETAVYPGHNAATTIAREKRCNEFLQG